MKTIFWICYRAYNNHRKNQAKGRAGSVLLGGAIGAATQSGRLLAPWLVRLGKRNVILHRLLPRRKTRCRHGLLETFLLAGKAIFFESINYSAGNIQKIFDNKIHTHKVCDSECEDILYKQTIQRSQFLAFILQSNSKINGN